MEDPGERWAGKQTAAVMHEVGSWPTLGGPRPRTWDRMERLAGNHSSRGGTLRGPETAGLREGEGLVTPCPADALGDSGPALAGLSTPGSQ